MWIKFVHCRLPQIYICHFIRIKNKGGKERKRKNNTDADTMCGNILIPVNQNSCILHYQKLENLTTSAVSKVKHMPHQIVFGGIFMISG